MSSSTLLEPPECTDIEDQECCGKVMLFNDKGYFECTECGTILWVEDYPWRDIEAELDI